MSNLKSPMATALEPLARQMREQTPLIRPVSRVAFEIKGEQAFERTIQLVVAWMRRRSTAIPDCAFKGEPFNVGGGGNHPAEAVRVDGDGLRLWSAILDDTDKEVARRTWVTEMTVGEREGRTAFGARLFNVTNGVDVPFIPSRPGVVHGIISNLKAEADGMPLLSSAVAIEAEDDFQQFWDLLIDPDRTLPLIVASAPDGTQPVFDLDILSLRVSGLAHVVKLTEAMSWALTDRLGKKLSVFDGATRIYAPEFDPNTANPFDHGLWLRRPEDSGEDRERRLAQIITWTLSNSVRSQRITNFPRYSEIRRWSDENRSKAAKAQGQSDVELVKLYEDEVKRLTAALESEKSEHNELLMQADQERGLAEAKEREAREENWYLRQRLELMEAALRDSGKAVADEPLTRYEDIGPWADKHLVGSVWISNKALRETAKSGTFGNIDQFWNTLILLRDYFVPMRRVPGQDKRDAYLAALADMGLEDSGCFGNPNDIKQFPEYKVTYRGEECWCNNHIKFGAGYDPKTMFRIYYHWHARDRVLLIGHMPTHLDNMRTN